MLLVVWAIPSPVLAVPITPVVPDPQLEWIEQLGNCESMGSTTVKVLDTNNKYSYGLLQFQMATWLKYGKDFGATKDNIFDPDLQKTVARSMLDAGGANNWYNCAHSVERKLGSYPL